MSDFAPTLEPPAPLLVPTRSEWERLSAEERLAFQVRAGEVLTEIARNMGEGRPHSTARSRALDVLRGHFDRGGRAIYLGSDMPVLYPGEPSFAPDLFAVIDVVDPGEADRRMAWSVVDEGRGLDFVLEILHGANPGTDLVANVHFYAKLGIPEYFVYDRRTERLVTHRLEGKRYVPVPLRFGRYPSAALGIDFSVVDGRLTFHAGSGRLEDSREVIQGLSDLVRSIEERADRAQQQAQDAQQQAQDSRDALRRTALRLLERQGLELTEEQRQRLDACVDLETLEHWIEAAIEGKSTI
jgi:Uma2 family endonuclease